MVFRSSFSCSSENLVSGSEPFWYQNLSPYFSFLLPYDALERGTKEASNKHAAKKEINVVHMGVHFFQFYSIRPGDLIVSGEVVEGVGLAEVGCIGCATLFVLDHPQKGGW